MSRPTEIVADPVPAAALARWLAAEVPEVAVASGAVTVEKIAGGHSNLTYRIVDDAGAAWALRRPPTGGVLATAHDMSRERRYVSALHPTGVPVARPVAYGADPGVSGAEFYLMEFVGGTVLGDREAGEAYPRESRRAAGLAVVDVLAGLHSLDPAAVGLGDLHRPGSYLERQLRRWHRQVHASAVEDLSVVDAAHDRLTALLPRDERVGIAHGDYRAGNLSFTPDGRIAAVFDWELATIGDPLADLGWLLMSWARPGDTVPAGVAGPSELPGFPERDELVARYGEGTGSHPDPGLVDYYVAFARWRSACIGAGVYSRYVAGVMGATDADTSTWLAKVQAQAAAALDSLAG